MNVTFKGVPPSFKDLFWSVESIQPKLCCVGILGIPRALHRWVLSHKALGQECSVGVSVSSFLCVSLPILQTNRSSNEAKSLCIQILDNGPSSKSLSMHFHHDSCPGSLLLAYSAFFALAFRIWKSFNSELIRQSNHSWWAFLFWNTFMFWPHSSPNPKGKEVTGENVVEFESCFWCEDSNKALSAPRGY